MSTADYTTWSGLAKYLAQVCDVRSPRGQRYEWPYLLVLLAAALMAGERTLVGMHHWLHMHEAELVKLLQPRRRCIPSVITLGRVLGKVKVEELEEAVSRFQRELAGECGAAGSVVTQQGEQLVGQALDGKTVRGASAHGELVHLVSLVQHACGLVYDQVKASVKLHERRAAEVIFGRNDLRHTVTTTDALHTSKKQARQLLAGGGDYLFVVKGNQRTLYDDISAVFTVLPPHGSWEQEYWQYEAVTVPYYGHGRTELLTLESTTALNSYLPFPGIAQVVRRTRWVLEHSSGKTTVSVEYLITSLSRNRVTLDQIEQFRRGHWTIENVTHYPRDESFGEDRSTIRTGNAPQALAALRNAVAALLRIEGWNTLPAGFRYCRQSPQRSLKLLGIPAT
jgi:predicted transposase YbfD/YdcC